MGGVLSVVVEAGFVFGGVDVPCIYSHSNRVTVDDFGLCCVRVTCFERLLIPFVRCFTTMQ